MCTLDEILNTKPNVIHSVPSTKPVLDAVNQMCAHHVRALLVRDSAAFVGIVSERDVMTRVLLHGLDPKTTEVGSIMTRGLVCVPLSAEPDEVDYVMTQCHCRHVPVLKDGKVLGIISRGDLVRWAIRVQGGEIRALRDYVTGAYPR